MLPVSIRRGGLRSDLDARRWTRSCCTDREQRVVLQCASDLAQSMLTGLKRRFHAQETCARKMASAGGGTTAGDRLPCCLVDCSCSASCCVCRPGSVQERRGRAPAHMLAALVVDCATKTSTRRAQCALVHCRNSPTSCSAALDIAGNVSVCGRKCVNEGVRGCAKCATCRLQAAQRPMVGRWQSRWSAR